MSVGSFVRIMGLENGKAQLAEVTLAEGSPAIGRTVHGLGLPRDAAVVAVMRQGHVVLPREDLPLQQGDEVMVLITGDGESDVRATLVGETA